MTERERFWVGGTSGRSRMGAVAVVLLMLVCGANGAIAQDANPHRRPAAGADTVILKGTLPQSGAIRVRPGASALRNRAVSTPFLVTGHLCMWHHDPGGQQAHFMQSGTCPAPRGAKVGDFCQCRAHGDQHRGYIDGRVVAARTGGKTPPLH